MVVAVQCTACSHRFAVRDELAGRRIRCVQCQAVLTVGASPAQDAEVVERRTVAEPVPEPRQRRNSAQPAARRAAVVKPSEPSPQARQSPPAARRISQASPSAEPETLSYEQLSGRILSAFEYDEIDLVPLPFSYRIGIVLVAAAMLLMLAAYFSLIGVVGWCVWYHATHHFSMVSSAASSASGRNSGRAAIFAFLVYLAPVLAGLVLLLFMLKPLFSKPASDGGRRSLKPEDEPLLFEFVDRICDAVRAPRPRRIDIDCNVNASAGFGRGMLSMFGNDLVLTVGMPLVAGLDVRQFAGVLAHEFGHFAQGVGMRVTYIIRTISYWFTRVVYERDSWDERLESAASSLDIRIGWMLHLTRLAVWFTRRILWVLMMLGHAVSGYLLRQMEFDADRHEAHLAGSRTFGRTARRLAILNVAHQGAMHDLQSFYSEGRLGDNLPRLIVLNVGQMPKTVIRKIDERTAEATTGWLDTHPADRERIASAENERAPGIFRFPGPASQLFRRFDFHSRAVTWDFYREVFGEELRREDIHPVDDLVERQRLQIESWKAMRRFLQGPWCVFRPLDLPETARAASSDVKSYPASLKKLRQSMLQMADSYHAARKSFEEQETRLLETSIAGKFLKVKLRIPKTLFSTPLTSHKAVTEAEEEAAGRQFAAESTMLDFEQAAQQRLQLGIQLARVPQVAQELEAEGVAASEIGLLVSLLHQCHELHESLAAVRSNQLIFGSLLMQTLENQENVALIDEARSLMAELFGQIGELQAAFHKYPYPFDHARSDITVAEFILKEMPEADDPGQVGEAAENLSDALTTLWLRVLGRLMQIVELVELQTGLPRLPDPPEDEDPEDSDSD